ncbi:MAG TPA: hypothetical protein VNB23_00430, partial [Ramlibacter sp.]|nr:hypothetical protein [Ramlibacter sp.]
MKQLATALLGLALAGIALTYAANQKSVGIQGPGTARAVTDDTLWLVVNEELWTLDRGGHRTGVRTSQQLGLAEAVSNIVPAPGGQAILTSRGDLAWQVVDRATLARVRGITPKWPADFADNYLRAIHLAVAPDGDVAVATGGGHAVLLFDAQGGYKARTAAGTYRFTNGIFWSPEGWWTTDTNRFALHLLDAQTLAVKRSVQLQAAPGGHPFLGEALPSHGRPHPVTQQQPLATLSRVGTLMEPGHAVDVFADGSQLVFNHAAIPQLRDIAWFGGELLVVDGDAFAIQRFNADRTAGGAFGDAQVRAVLRQMHADRVFWRNLGSRYALLASAALLIAGLAAYARHRRLAALDVVAGRTGGHAAAAASPLRRLARQRLWIYGVPIALRLVVLALAGFV